MPSICPDRLRRIRRLAVDADAARDRLRDEISDARDDLRRLKLQQGEARKAPAPPAPPAPPEGGTVGPRSGAAPKDAVAHADARVAQVEAQLAELQDAYSAASRKAGKANTLWTKCQDFARQHGVTETTFETEGASHAQ